MKSPQKNAELGPDHKLLLGRETVLADGFETAYHVLRAQYLAFCSKAFAEAQTWQAAESALLAVRWA